MDKSQLVKTSMSNTILNTAHDTKDEKHRLAIFQSWLQETNRSWFNPDLETYREYLLHKYSGRQNSPLSPISVRSHLATLRSRYRSLLKSNRIRDLLYQQINTELSPTDKKTILDELYERMRNSIDPINSSVRIVHRQDIEDSTQLRLTVEQAQQLVKLTDTQTLIGKRDRALISLLLCTGIREAELCSLHVNDLKKHLGGELALHVRHGKGAKERLIPYGELIWGLNYTLHWLESANIASDAVFRGFYRGGKRIRPTPLTKRAINQILDKYPIMVSGEIQTVKPHDLRRTYARLLYESGMDLLAIRDNLGHSDTRTTLRYIGTMDVVARKPRNIYNI